jgi:hypothetical protein
LRMHVGHRIDLCLPDVRTHPTCANPWSMTGVCVCANLPIHPSQNAENAPGLDLLPQDETGIGILEESKENRLGMPL